MTLSIAPLINIRLNCDTHDNDTQSVFGLNRGQPKGISQASIYTLEPFSKDLFLFSIQQ
jgi:hypothetical protein